MDKDSNTKAIKQNLNKIIDQLFDYASGDFTSRCEFTNQGDDIDALIMGINILGEELESRTISRDYFTALFNRSFNLIFVFNENFEIIDANIPGLKKLNCIDKESLTDKRININSILRFYYKPLKKEFNDFIKSKHFEKSFKFDNNLIIKSTSIPVSCICSFI